MSDVLPQLLLVVVLIVINAAFAGTELALVSLREGQLQRLEQRSSTGALLARLAREPNNFFATIQIGITLAGFLASAAAAVSLAEPLEEPLSFLGGAAGPVSVIVVTLILSYFTLVFGELAPKRLAMQRAERWGMVMARPLSALTTITRPVVWLLAKSTDIVVKVFGGDPDVQREEVTEEELRDMVALHETVTPEQRRIIDSAFEAAERRLDEILVPRYDVVVIDASASTSDAIDALVSSGHSRAPVAPDRNLDHVIGAVHLQDLVRRADTPIGDDVRELPVFPISARVLTALRELQARRTQMALVINEHGGSAGIVTVEDLVEELVGEIYDETDPDLATVTYDDDGTIVFPGRFPVHDVIDFDIDLPEGDYATVAGLVLDREGRFPSVGEVVAVDGWLLEIREVARHSIRQIAVRRDPSVERAAEDLPGED